MPRGFAKKTPELVAEVIRLRDEEKLIFRDIADRVRISLASTQEWYSDRDGSKRAARRDRYRGECMDCGAPTDGSNGPGSPAKRCQTCARAAGPSLWTREAIVAAIQAWLDEYGKVPVASDWNPPSAIALGYPERAERFRRDDSWPYSNTVVCCFGTWNAAIRAAGFEPKRSGYYGRPGESVTVEDVVPLYVDEGLSMFAIAKRLGCSDGTVASRLHEAGVQLRPQGFQPGHRHSAKAAA